MLKVEWRKYLAVCSCILLLFGLSFATIFTNGEVRAHDVSYDVSINSTLSVALPYNNIILDLNPYNKTFEHKGMSMMISTNSNAGYEMTLTSTGGATSLTDEQDNAKTIETLPALAGGYNESDFVANKWGYSLNGANYQPFVSGATLAASAEGTSAAVSLDFASKVDYSQAPGSYSIELNFNAVGHISPLYMQNLSPNLCTTTPTLVADIRDEQLYYIQRLADGNCWMMTNLNLGGVDFINDINQYNTNISGVIEANDFFAWKKNNSGGGTGTLDAGEFYSQTGADPTSDTPYGTLYNYYAASAGTIKGANNTSDATEDICPAGWQMPESGFWDKKGYENLYRFYDTNALMRASMADDGAAFALSGMFYNGAPTNVATQGFFWTSSYDGVGEGMASLGLDAATVSIPAYYNRGFGMAIRCVLKEEGGADQVLPNMQDFNTVDETQLATALAAMNVGEVYTMKDSRDSQEYKVAKLEDGNVWMLDNLRLGGDTAIELTPADTNITSNWTLPASGTVCFSSSSCTDTSGTSGTGYTRPAINADSKDTVASTIYGEGSNKFGVYYNYCAASAGTICSSSASTTPTQDICPAGWRLATKSDNSNLYSKYTNYTATNTNSFQYNLSTPLSGRFNGSLSSQDAYAYIWSTGNYSTTQTYDTYISPTSVNTGSYAYRYYGQSVRCMFADPGYTVKEVDPIKSYGITTMQELANLPIEKLRILESRMETGKKYEIKDSRDNQTYTVSKLDDGNIWMTKNLNLGAVDLVQNLDSSNTNISTTIDADDFNAWKKDSGSASYVDKEFIPVSAAGYTLYNYCAASAGTYCYDSESGTGDATQDICPAGWRLPTGGEYNELLKRYSGSVYSLFGATYTFSSSSPSSSSYSGYYWTSTFKSASTIMKLYSYYTNTSSSEVSGAYRSNGYAVRCTLSKDRDNTINMTMQDFSGLSAAERNLVISIMQTGKNYELKDSRDNQTYTIAKLKDGNVWMTQNLNLGVTDLTQDLTPINTNISTMVDAAVFNGWRKESSSNTRIKGEFIPKSGVDSDSQTPYGVTYNYCAVSAGTYCLIIERNNNEESIQDICPAGWKLPTGGSSSEFNTLGSKYSSHLTDRITFGGAAFVTGSYWTPNYYSDLNMVTLKISSNTSRENSSANRGSLLYVRCILKQE